MIGQYVGSGIKLTTYRFLSGDNNCLKSDFVKANKISTLLQ